jgi:hypothetical protein
MSSEREHKDDYHEGPDAARRFETTLSRALTVSKTELGKREAAYKKSRAAKPSRHKRAEKS